MAKSKGPKLPQLPKVNGKTTVKDVKPKRAKKTISKTKKGPKMPEKVGFKVPEEDRQEYRRLVQKANRRVKSNLEYIKNNKIKDFDTRRKLVDKYESKRKWARNKNGKRAKSPLSRSINFKNKEQYEDYMHHLRKLADKNPREMEKGYKSTIIDRLQRIANIYHVTLPDNKIPDELVDKVNELDLPQLINWFHIGDPSEDMEVSEYGSDDFIGVKDWQDFHDIAVKRLNQLQKFIH